MYNLYIKMTSVGTVFALVIIFILIAVLIIMSIMAMVATNKNSKRKSYAVHEFNGLGTHETMELLETAYINYNVTSNAKLTLSGKKGNLVIITNQSDHIINIIPNQNIPEYGTIFKIRKGIINEDNSYYLTGKNSIIIVWKEDNIAKITKI